MAYAEDTDVPVSRSKEQIEALIRKRGGSNIFVGWDENAGRAGVMWSMDKRQVRLTVPIPDVFSDEIRKIRNSYRTRSDSACMRRHEQVQRTRWRCLLLCIKAKFESIDSGVETFEEAFLSQTLLADGKAVGETMLPQLEAHYENRAPVVGLLGE